MPVFVLSLRFIPFNAGRADSCEPHRPRSPMRKVLSMVDRSANGLPRLLLGETGVGKRDLPNTFIKAVARESVFSRDAAPFRPA